MKSFNFKLNVKLNRNYSERTWRNNSPYVILDIRMYLNVNRFWTEQMQLKICLYWSRVVCAQFRMTKFVAIDIVSNLVFWSRKMNKLVLLRINNFCQQWQKALLFTWLTGSLSLVNSVNGLRPSYDENFSIFPQHATTHCVKRRLLRLVWTDLKEETDPFTHRALYNRRNFLLCVIPPF